MSIFLISLSCTNSLFCVNICSLGKGKSRDRVNLHVVSDVSDWSLKISLTHTPTLRNQTCKITANFSEKAARFFNTAGQYPPISCFGCVVLYKKVRDP